MIRTFSISTSICQSTQTSLPAKTKLKFTMKVPTLDFLHLSQALNAFCGFDTHHCVPETPASDEKFISTPLVLYI
jgi:hypothetical protein